MKFPPHSPNKFRAAIAAVALVFSMVGAPVAVAQSADSDASADSRPATLGDLKELRRENRREFRELRHEMREENRELRQEIREENREFRQEIRAEVQGVRETMNAIWATIVLGFVALSAAILQSRQPRPQNGSQPASKFQTAAVVVAFAVAAAYAAFFIVMPVLAQNTESQQQNPESGQTKPLVVLELFTSQGCYSCPPAEKLVDEVFTKNPNLLPLEMHVDYWDDLIYGLAGSWEDPFSSEQFSQRQFAYNLKLRGNRGGYTPQMIVHGAAQTGGSRRDHILRLAEKAAETIPDIKINFSGDSENGFTAEVEGAMNDGMRIASAVFYRREVTEVKSGENKGKTLANSNIVTQLKFAPASRRQVKFPALDPERQSCAVWVQRGGGLGPIVAAARCPEI